MQSGHRSNAESRGQLDILPLQAELPRLGRVCRLGLATRGGGGLQACDALAALDRGINYWNWCGHPDGMQQAVRKLGSRRSEVRLAVQLESRTATAARSELDAFLRQLGTTYLDVVAYYYVEHEDEWDQIVAPGGAAECIERARDAGSVRAIGVTGHQRPLLARIIRSGRVDLVMARYNAAHRGAEREVFPVAHERGVAVVAFTCLRWGALLRSTPDDPAELAIPPAAAWYRYVLDHPQVSVALMAPGDGGELRENLTLLDDWRGLQAEERAALEQHGQRVRRHAGAFP